MKKHIYSLLAWTLLVWLSFFPLMDFYKNTSIGNIMTLVLQGLFYLLPIPSGDQYWILGLFMGLLYFFINAFVIVFIVYYFAKMVWPIIHYFWREIIKPKE